MLRKERKWNRIKRLVKTMKARRKQKAKIRTRTAYKKQ